MIVLVSNIGSTSFKFKLFDFACNEHVIAEGANDRIGLGGANWWVAVAEQRAEGTAVRMDLGRAIDLNWNKLSEVGGARRSNVDQSNSLSLLDRGGAYPLGSGIVSEPITPGDSWTKVPHQSLVTLAPGKPAEVQPLELPPS